MLRRAARAVFSTLGEEQAYERLLAEHICVPNVHGADDGGTGISRGPGRIPDTPVAQRKCAIPKSARSSSGSARTLPSQRKTLAPAAPAAAPLDR